MPRVEIEQALVRLPSGGERAVRRRRLGFVYLPKVAPPPAPPPPPAPRAVAIAVGPPPKPWVPPQTRREKVEYTLVLVGNQCNLDVAEIKSCKRQKRVVRPRQIAMYLCETMWGMARSDIARDFGGCDRTTVYNAIERIEILIGTDAQIAEHVAALRQLIHMQNPT